MTMRNVPLSALRFGDEAPGSINARATGREEEMGQLVASIRANGLIQALTVRRANEGDDEVFHVIDGNRRLAARVAGPDGERDPGAGLHHEDRAGDPADRSAYRRAHRRVRPRPETAGGSSSAFLARPVPPRPAVAEAAE